MRVIKTLLIMFFSVLLCSGLQSQKLPTARAEDVGMSSARLARIYPLILEGIESWEYPGAVLLVGRKGKIVFREAFGYFQWKPEERRMRINHIFDMASVTKPVATATAIMILVERGKIRLWDTVKKYVPGFRAFEDEEGGRREDARIWHLLTHTSGLPPYTNAAAVAKKYGDPCSTRNLVKYIAQLEKTGPAGQAFHYSCLGYITMASIIELVTGQTVAEFALKNIFSPIGMVNTFYNPPEKFRPRCVPTELVGSRPLQGVVHDPLARLQGGVSGNAGLFSTVDDLAVFAQMILNKGRFRGVQVLSPLTVERMTEIYPRVDFSGRGLGWDLESGYATNQGDLFGVDSVSHTGYTGTSLSIDPETETFVIFLTNRVHPDDRGSVVSIRSRVANVVAASILDK